MWRWVYGENNGAIEPATAEETKKLKEEYGDFSRFLNHKCRSSR